MLASDNNLRATADIIGMGPIFKIKIFLENLGSTPLTEMYMNYNYDPKIYKLIDPVY